MAEVEPGNEDEFEDGDEWETATDEDDDNNNMNDGNANANGDQLLDTDQDTQMSQNPDDTNDNVDPDFDDGDDEWGNDGDGWDDDTKEGGDGDWGDDDEPIDIQSGKIKSIIQTEIPSITETAIQSNCDEINMLPLFCAAPDLKSRSRIGAMVAIKVANLTNITQDQLEVWGLTPEFPYIALKFEFGPFYLNEAKVPKVEVGICRKLNVDEKLHSFRLSWTMCERTKNSMLSNAQWPPRDFKMKDIPSASAINELMETSAKEYALCLQALKQCSGDTDQALNVLLDPDQIKRLNKKLPSQNKCRAEFSDIMGKISTKEEKTSEWGGKKKNWQDQYENANFATKIQQLSEAFGIPMQAATLAVDSLGYDKASEELAKADVREQFIQMCAAVNDDSKSQIEGDTFDNNNKKNKNKNKKEKKKKGIFGKVMGALGGKNHEEKKDDDGDMKLADLEGFENMVRNVSGGGKLVSIQSEDFFRTIVVMSRHNFLLRVICFALKVLLNGNKYCMICDKQLAFAGLKPTICSERFCQWRHDQIGLGFSLASEVTNRPDIVDLLLSMTYSAANAGRIQFFFPYGCRGLDPDTQSECFLLSSTGSGPPTEIDLANFDPVKFSSGEVGQPKPDTVKLKEVLDLCPDLAIMATFAKEGDPHLKKELTKIHCLLYPLLVWIITSNRAHLRKLSPSERIGAIDTEDQFALCSATPTREAEFQTIKKNNHSFLAWHGSPMGNWHSILRMGLRNYSKTKHQTNGAAYGNGIYFARNFNLSWGYCRAGSNPGWKKSKFGAQMSCMALCEICYHDGDAKHHAQQIDPFMKGKYDTDASNKKAAFNPSGDWQKTTNKENRWVKTNGIYVVDDEKCVMTRFFLIFRKTSGYKALEANSLMGTLPAVVRTMQ